MKKPTLKECTDFNMRVQTALMQGHLTNNDTLSITELVMFFCGFLGITKKLYENFYDNTSYLVCDWDEKINISYDFALSHTNAKIVIDNVADTSISILEDMIEQAHFSSMTQSDIEQTKNLANLIHQNKNLYKNI